MKSESKEFDGAEFFTVGLDLGNSIAASFHCILSDGLCGIASLEGANDSSEEYVPINVSRESIEGEALLLNAATCGFRYLRLGWMPTCGSGKVKIISIIKD